MRERERERERAMHKMQHESDTSDKEFETVRTETCNLHSIRSGLVAKLKTRICQETAILDYKIDTGSNGNLTPINMFQTLFQETLIAELDEYINRKVVLHAYNDSNLN